MNLNLWAYCTDTYSDGITNCTKVAQDIATYQFLGKKVLLSLGGGKGNYGFENDADAVKFAQILWDTFGEGTGSTERPFDSAIVDGFDFDIENGAQTGYDKLVTELRAVFATGGKDYYISATPQYVFPDAHVGNLLLTSDIDFVFIQFYNNLVWNVNGGSFNWDTWLNYAESLSPNKNVNYTLAHLVLILLLPSVCSLVTLGLLVLVTLA